MKEFLLVFRRDFVTKAVQPSPEQIQGMMKPWQDWMGSLAAQNKLADAGNRLNSEGRVVKPNNVVTNGPYVETKEAIGGYIIIKAADMDEAAELAKGCPILQIGGNVEVRNLVAMDDNS
ncbi:MAG TPA: YciI family protein [Puia sp.]